MIKKSVVTLLLPIAVAGAEPKLNLTPVLHQTAAYFSSDRVTLAGMGFGGGFQMRYGKTLVAQTDANILWINGNAVSARLALGVQREGRWQPALFVTFDLLWGQRTEVLSATGQRPAIPVWVIGIRGTPLRFSGLHGTASTLELGYGIGPDQGRMLEITILSAVGWHW
jgi:hypothetical protein